MSIESVKLPFSFGFSIVADKILSRRFQKTKATIIEEIDEAVVSRKSAFSISFRDDSNFCICWC
jgi:hypothetical protein